MTETPASYRWHDDGHTLTATLDAGSDLVAWRLTCPHDGTEYAEDAPADMVPACRQSRDEDDTYLRPYPVCNVAEWLDNVGGELIEVDREWAIRSGALVGWAWDPTVESIVIQPTELHAPPCPARLLLSRQGVDYVVDCAKSSADGHAETGEHEGTFAANGHTYTQRWKDNFNG